MTTFRSSHASCRSNPSRSPHCQHPGGHCCWLVGHGVAMFSGFIEPMNVPSTPAKLCHDHAGSPPGYMYVCSARGCEDQLFPGIYISYLWSTYRNSYLGRSAVPDAVIIWPLKQLAARRRYKYGARRRYKYGSDYIVWPQQHGPCGCCVDKNNPYM